AVFEHQVGEVPEPQQLGFLAPQFQNPAQNPAIIVIAGGGARAVSVVDLPPYLGIVEIRHERQITRPLQGEPPALHALGFGTGPVRRDSSRWQPRQLPRVADYKME